MDVFQRRVEFINNSTILNKKQQLQKYVQFCLKRTWLLSGTSSLFEPNAAFSARRLGDDLALMAPERLLWSVWELHCLKTWLQDWTGSRGSWVMAFKAVSTVHSGDPTLVEEGI